MQYLIKQVATVLLLALPALGYAQGEGRPNVVFILVDDLGYHDLGFTGSTFYETPNLDALAARATVFRTGYAASRVCSPSRASIMTGKFPARHGITDWIGAAAGTDWRRANRHTRLLPADYVRQLPAADSTLAEAFRAHGYRTFFAGKWHLGAAGSAPEDHGFDINHGGYESGSPRGGFFAPYNNPRLTDGPDGENLTLRLARETADFITQQGRQPFLAFLSFYAVHAPIETTQAQWAKYRAKAAAAGLAPEGYALENRLPIRRVQDNPVYAGLVSATDEAVGTVLDALERAGIADHTIVVFTSDNGGVASGDNYATSNLPLRGGKGYQWEGGIREPYLIYAPMLRGAVSAVDAPVTGTDFFPTLLELAGLPLLPEQHADGRSLLPLMRGDTLAERSLFWHYPHYGNQGGDPSSIIRRGDWKLIYYFEDQHYELYNLRTDPGERQNLASREPAQLDAMVRELHDWYMQLPVKFPIPDPAYRVADEQAWLERMATQKRAELEAERRAQLQEGWQPNADWWGSKE